MLNGTSCRFEKLGGRGRKIMEKEYYKCKIRKKELKTK